MYKLYAMLGLFKSCNKTLALHILSIASMEELCNIAICAAMTNEENQPGLGCFKHKLWLNFRLINKYKELIDV